MKLKLFILCVFFIMIFSVFVIAIPPPPFKPSIGGGGGAKESAELAKKTGLEVVELEITVDGDPNLDQDFEGELEIDGSISGDSVIKADHDFDSGKVDFDKITVKVQDEDSKLGAIAVENFELEKGEARVAYVTYVNKNSNGVCVVEKKSDNPSDVSTNCDADKEQFVVCDSKYHEGYKCKKKANMLEVSGIQNDDFLIIQKQIDVDALPGAGGDDDDDDDDDSGESGGFSWLWFIIIAIIVAGAGAGFVLYQKKGGFGIGAIFKKKEPIQQAGQMQQRPQQVRPAMDNSLKLYIDNALSQGYTKQQIIAHLVQHGYTQQQLEHYF